MTVISVRDFRSRQTHYLQLARSGEHVILRSRQGQFRLTPMSDEESERNVTAEICQGMKDWRDELDGINTGRFRPAEELIDELRNL